MNQLGPFLALIGVVAIVLAGFGAVVGWWNEEGRRVRRGLRKVLKGETHALIVAYGRGRGAGFNFSSNMMAVAWDGGGWCLVYRIDELQGVELIVDGLVGGRAFRGETRRPLDNLGGAQKQVSLRLVFDDPQHPDFMLELWSADRPAKGPLRDAGEAVEEGNRWLARISAIFRRQSASFRPTRVEAAPEPLVSRRPEPEVDREAEPAPEPVFALQSEPEPDAESARAAPRRPAARAAAQESRQELPFDDEPPWDEDEDDQPALL